MIKFLCWLKVNLIALKHETLISQALIDMEISHEEFITILKEKDKMKDNLRSEGREYGVMRLSSVKSKI